MVPRRYRRPAGRRDLPPIGPLGSTGVVGDALDNVVAESFFASPQSAPLDRDQWHTRAELARLIFHHLEVPYNALRRHSTLGYLNPIDY